MCKVLVLVGVVALASACTGKSDTSSKANSDGYSETTVLKAEHFRECMDAAGSVFWPPSLFPVLAYGLPAIAPPYEITHVGAALMEMPKGLPGPGQTCLGETGLKVGVWVSTETPERFPLDGQGRPMFPTLAEVLVQGPLEPTSDLAAGYFEVALDPPVLVEEHGTVWVAAVNHDLGVPEGCLAGCFGNGDAAYQWVPDYGWVVQDSLPLFKVTLAHD